MKKVRYNFDTGKAFISNVITQQGEGNIVANTAKKNADNSFYMVNAKSRFSLLSCPLLFSLSPKPILRE
jgi:hypothetical protein